MSLCSTLDSSRLSLVLGKDVIIKRSAFITTRRTRGVPWAHTLRRCVNLRRLTSALMGLSARRLTIESNLFTIRRSTRPNSVRKARKRAVTSEICAHSRTLRTNSQSICCIAWSKTLISTCSISRQSGALLMTKSRATCEMSVNMRTIGKTIGENLTNTSTHRKSSADSGARRRRLKTTVMAVTWSIAVSIVTAGRRKSTTRITTKSQLATVFQIVRRSIVHTITRRAR